MKVINFEQMFVSVPMAENENIEDVENKLIEAIESNGDGVVLSYKISVEEYEDD